MQRYFVEKIIENQNIIINNDDFYHITKVMRMHIGDKVYLCDCVLSCVAKITEITKQEVVLEIDEMLNEDKELSTSITIAHGIIRKEKMEETIEKISALGANFYLPVEMERCNAKFHDDKIEKKMIRLNKIAKEACEQSHRTNLLEVLLPLSFKNFLKKCSEYDLLLVAYENTNPEETIRKVINQRKYNNILVLIGPEGGISEKELEVLEKTGFIKVSLGKRILRTELAPVYAMSVIGYEMEN